MRKINKLIIISLTAVFIFMACSNIHTDNPNEERLQLFDYKVLRL